MLDQIVARGLFLFLAFLCGLAAWLIWRAQVRGRNNLTAFTCMCAFASFCVAACIFAIRVRVV